MILQDGSKITLPMADAKIEKLALPERMPTTDLSKVFPPSSPPLAATTCRLARAGRAATEGRMAERATAERVERAIMFAASVGGEDREIVTN